jgi:hypothetical protein
MSDPLIGLAVGTDRPCDCGASGGEIRKAGKTYVVQCRCSLLRMKLSDATVNFLKPTIREFGVPTESITIMRGSAAPCGLEKMEMTKLSPLHRASRDTHQPAR